MPRAKRTPQKRNAIFSTPPKKCSSSDEAVVLPVYYYVGVQFYHGDKLTGVQANLIDDHPFRCMAWK
jgi:oligopeptide transport system substrate-binding protein